MNTDNQTNDYLASQEERDAAITAIEAIDNVDYDEAVQRYEARLHDNNYEEHEED